MRRRDFLKGASASVAAAAISVSPVDNLMTVDDLPNKHGDELEAIARLYDLTRRRYDMPLHCSRPDRERAELAGVFGIETDYSLRHRIAKARAAALGLA